MTSEMFAFRRLLANADDGALERGHDVAQRGKVSFGSISETVVQASVQGTVSYRVVLTAGEDESWSCECPAAADGSFCKHCVAVVVALAAPMSAAPNGVKAQDGPPSDGERIDAYVRSLSAEDLAEIVLEQAWFDQQLSSRLLAMAAAEAGEKIDLREWKKRVTAAFRGPGGFIAWRQASEWARGVHDMLDVLVAFLAAGHATEVAALAEHAHKRAESAVNRVDDSGGEITQIFTVIGEIHLAAAEAGAYPPKKLGKRLADLELAASLDTFHRSAIAYADVLGSEGLDAYLAVVEKAHAKLGPGADRWGPAFRIRHARVAHTIATVDPDQLIEIYGDQQQMTSSDYVELVELLIVARRVDEAEDWADRGLSDPGSQRSLGSLLDLKATLVRGRDGGGAEIEELYWAEFLRRPTALTVRDLLANSEEPVATRSRVFAKLDTSIEVIREALIADEVDDAPFRQLGTSSAQPGSVGAPQRYLQQHPGAGLTSAAIIEVLVELEEIERAWAVALEFGATAIRWSGLAEHRAADHPGDAIEWQLVAAQIEIDHKSRKNYRRAVRHLQSAQTLAAAHDRVEDGPLSRRVDAAVEALANEHSNKRALLEELVKGGWPNEKSS